MVAYLLDRLLHRMVNLLILRGELIRHRGLIQLQVEENLMSTVRHRIDYHQQR